MELRYDIIAVQHKYHMDTRPHNYNIIHKYSDKEIDYLLNDIKKAKISSIEDIKKILRDNIAQFTYIKNSFFKV